MTPTTVIPNAREDLLLRGKKRLSVVTAGVALTGVWGEADTLGYASAWGLIVVRCRTMSSGEFSIYRAIDIVRRRPGMYIGDPSPDKLLVYLWGYMLAMDHAGLEDKSEPSLQGFHNWVAKRFGFYESTAGWANMILAVTLGLDPRTIRWEGYDATATRAQLIEATERCFTLLDEYRGHASSGA